MVNGKFFFTSLINDILLRILFQIFPLINMQIKHVYQFLVKIFYRKKVNIFFIYLLEVASLKRGREDKLPRHRSLTP